MQGSVLTLLEFRKAYDTVWREKWLFHMLDTAIPSTFICWIHSFFYDCTAHVQFFNAFSSNRCFTYGSPQGSVLGPLIFPFNINNLASSLNDDAVIALCWLRVNPHYSLQKRRCWSCCPVSSKLWSKEWKLNLNADKSATCPFSTWSNNSTWDPTIFIGTQKDHVNTTPHFLVSFWTEAQQLMQTWRN